VEIPYTPGQRPEVLASGKLVVGNGSSEGSQTAIPIAIGTVLTNRNGIRGYRTRISNHIIATS